MTNDQKLLVKFQEYCQEYLTDGNFSSHKQAGSNIVDKEYFFLLFRTLVFWKNMRFEPAEKACLKKRR